MKNATHTHIRRLLPLLIVAGLASPATKVSAGVGIWTSGGPPNGGYISALAINPATPSTLYAGGGGGVFKTTDSGGTWTSPSTGFTSTGVKALAINPLAPSTLYAGTDYGGVFKSTDSGGTWATANAGLTESNVSALAINPATPSTIYAASVNAIFKSSNAGSSWAIVQPTSLFYVYYSALAINPATPATLYLGADGAGILKSTNAGDTWSWASSGLTSTGVTALVINPATPATLYAGTYDAGVFKSTDSGGTWAAANSGLTSSDVRALAINPASPATLYAGTHGGGVFRSTDSGGTWAAINAGLPALGVSTLTLDPLGTTLYAGLESGGVWQLTAASTGTITALLPASAHAPGANGAFYTTNVAVANVGAAPASFTMKFLGHDQDGSAGPERTFNLASGNSVTYFDVLGSVFQQTSAFGAIRITSDTAALKIVSVTSTPGFGGTLSQTIPAVLSSDLISAGSSRSILYIREDDGFRSNLVLASNASVPTTVDAALVSPDGTTLATKSYAVPPNGMTQINRVVRDMGVAGTITGARLVLSSSTLGAAFTAFASVIDETTNDPTAVEAK